MWYRDGNLELVYFDGLMGTLLVVEIWVELVASWNRVWNTVSSSLFDVLYNTVRVCYYLITRCLVVCLVGLSYCVSAMRRGDEKKSR